MAFSSSRHVPLDGHADTPADFARGAAERPSLAAFHADMMALYLHRKGKDNEALQWYVLLVLSLYVLLVLSLYVLLVLQYLFRLSCLTFGLSCAFSLPLATPTRDGGAREHAPWLHDAPCLHLPLIWLHHLLIWLLFLIDHRTAVIIKGMVGETASWLD